MLNLRFRYSAFALALATSAVLAGLSAPAAAQTWRSAHFPKPNGGLLVFTTIGNNPACASYNGSSCLWGNGQVDFRRVRPLVCGADHRQKWGVTGYEDRKHWCSLIRTGTIRGERVTRFD